MKYFPFFSTIENKRILIVGGGSLAAQKITALNPFGASITVIASQIYLNMDQYEEVTFIQKEYDSSDGEGFDILIAATDDPELNYQVYTDAINKNKPVNVVDNKDLCTFIFPSIVNAGDLTIGISSGGASPSATIWLKNNIKEMIPSYFEAILEWLEFLRTDIIESVPNQSVRSRIFHRLFDEAMENKGPLAVEQVEKIIKEERKKVD